MVKDKTKDSIEIALDLLGGAGVLASARRKLEVIPTELEDFNEGVLGCGVSLGVEL